VRVRNSLAECQNWHAMRSLFALVYQKFIEQSRAGHTQNRTTTAQLVAIALMGAECQTFALASSPDDFSSMTFYRYRNHIVEALDKVLNNYNASKMQSNQKPED
jgi:hypothetical protein